MFLFLGILFLNFATTNAFGVLGFYLDPEGVRYCHQMKDDVLNAVTYYLQGKHTNATLQKLMNPPSFAYPWLIPVVTENDPPLLVVDTWAALNQSHCFQENNETSKILSTVASQVYPPTFKLSQVERQAGPQLQTLYFTITDDIWVEKFRARMNLTIPHSTGFTQRISRLTMLYVLGTTQDWQTYYRLDINDLLAYVQTVVNRKAVGLPTQANEIAAYFNCGNTQNDYYLQTFRFSPR